MLRKNQKGSLYRHKLTFTKGKQIGKCSLPPLGWIKTGWLRVTALMVKGGQTHQGETEPPR